MSRITKFVDEREVEEGKEEKEINQAKEIHYLPLKIEFDGKAEVNERFSAFIKENEHYKETHFRGRPLKGTKLSLPPSYKGIVMDTNSKTLIKNSRTWNGNLKIESDLEQDSQKILYIKKEFQDLTYWNWDRIPSGMDAPVKAMDWLQLASKLHAPEEAESEVKTEQ